MGKFVGGLITGSVLTLAGLGIAAAISDGTFDDLFDSDNSFDDSDDTEDLNEKESSDAEDDKDYVSPAIGTALSSIFRKAADEVDKAGEVISNELEKEVHLTDEQRNKLVEKYGSVKEGLSVLLGNISEEDEEKVEA